jgi:nitrite reductase/ring-hydroxylating ferredoxin subunit
MSENTCPQRNVTEVIETKSQLSRKNFLTAIAAVAGTVGLSGIAKSASAATKKYKVCATKDVKVGSFKIFQIAGAGGRSVLITQPKAGVFRAFSSTCTHLGATLQSVRGSNLVCPIHQATFNTTTGAATGGPTVTPLSKFTLTKTGTTLYVSL